MLTSLHIRNYILIDSLDVDFPEGLAIITGQTGAGKSIILGALSLLLGAKADASAICSGADSCVVEAEFDIEREELRRVLEENEIEWDGGHLLIRRVVHSSGRARSFINDSPVPVPVLAEISSRLIDIHSQHQSLMLTDRGFQLSMLDSFAGNAAILAECRASWQKLNSLKSELRQTEDRLSRLSSEKDYNEARFRQLDSAVIRNGELAELDEEQKTLANAEEIKNSLCSAEELLMPSDDSAVSVVAALKEAQKLLSSISRYIPATESLAGRLESSRIELDDIISEISALNSKVDVSGSRLEAVEQRMSLIYELFRKFGCGSESELISLRERLSEAIYDSSALEMKVESLRKDIKDAETVYLAAAAGLHSARLEASGAFASSIQSQLRYLELDSAVFSVDVAAAGPGPDGTDSVSFLFDASGKNPKEVSKCASGGEISRIMLCLKAMMAKFEEMPTMIFDEIDTGVSGSVADKMGSMICDIGRDMQVFAITHLPQVAAKGDAHFLVSKSVGDETRSTIKKLSHEERVMEIARMLSGSTVTGEAIANAKSLLG